MSQAKRNAPTAVLALVLVVSAVAGGAPAVGAVSGTGVPAVDVDPDDVLLRVDVGPDGTAEWAIEYRVRLTDENATRAFESVQRDLEENETEYEATFGDRMQSTASTAENATDREMAVRNVSVSATKRQLPQEYGVVTYRFDWTGFAATDGDELRVGDALSGLFLDEETTLLISWPSEYRQTSIAPSPDERRTNAVLWTGPADFGPDEPRVVATSSPPPTEPGTEDDGEADDRNWLIVLVSAIAVGAAAAAGFVAVRRRRDDSDGTGDAAPDASRDDSPDAPGDTGPDASGTPEPEAETEPDAGPASEAGTEPESETPEQLLSNEERVLKLVRERGGRMKQKEVAETLDWTDAKTSQVVRKMRDDGQLEAFRLGRENVLTLPEEDERL